MRAEIAAGLKDTLKLEPGRGFLELGGGYGTNEGAFAYAQAEARIAKNQALFARGEWEARGEAKALVGYRLDF